MSITAKMYVDDMVYNIRRLDFGFDQEINTNGTASTQPLGGLFNIEVESPKNTHLYAWGASNLDMKHVKLVFSPVTLASKSRTIELYDTLCIRHHDYFHHESKDPMISVLQLSPAIIVQDGRTLFEKNWKVTDLNTANTALVADSNEEEEYTELYIVDKNNNRITELEIDQEIELVLKSTGKVGQTTSICLNDDKHDFIHKGVRLKNDALNDYAIARNIERIPLTVVEQLKEEE